MHKATLSQRLLVALACAVPAATQASSMLYVSDTLSQRVLVIDTATNKVVGGPIEIEHWAPLEPVVNRDGSMVYVQAVDGTISVIDAQLQRVVRTFENPNPQASEGAASITLSPDGRMLYAIAAYSNTIAVVDTTTGMEVRRMPFPGTREPRPTLRASHDGKRLFVMHPLARSIAVLDVETGRVLASAVVPGSDVTPGDIYTALSGIALDAHDRYIRLAWSDGSGGGSLATLDASSLAVVSSIPIGPRVGRIAAFPDGNRVVVAEDDGGCMVSVDLQSGMTTGFGAPGDTSCFNIAAGRDGRRVYVGTYDSVSKAYGVRFIDIDDLSAGHQVTSGLTYVEFDDQSIGPDVTFPEAGAWWNPAESGRAFNIEVRHGTLFVVASVYDAAGKPTWLTSSGPYDAATGTYTGIFGTTVNGPCLGCSYRVPDYASVGGSLKLVFTSATSGTLYFDGGSTPIQKFDW